MLSLISGFSNYIMGGLASALVALSIQYYLVTTANELLISSLKLEVQQLQTSGVINDMEIVDLEDALNMQSTATEHIAINYLESLEDLRVWQNKPPKVKYKTLYKKMPMWTQMTKGDCNDTSGFIKDIGTLNYSDF